MNLKTSVSFAAALAALLSACGQPRNTSQESPVTPSTGTLQQEVKCEGINECRGTAECASSDGSHACQGLNECRGQGWVTESSRQACESKGGKVIG